MFELINPHGSMRVMVPNPKGAQSEWSLELGGAGQLVSVTLPSGKVLGQRLPGLP